MKHVAIVHTSFVLVDVLNKLFDQYLPDVKRTHVVEHSILQDVLDAGRVTPDVMRRMLGYFRLAEETGADVIFNACSSVGETADVARQFIRIPVIKIDDAMAEEAVDIGQRIGVMATLKTTLDPTVRLVESHARRKGTDIQIVRALCDGAFDALTSGDVEQHDRMVQEKLLAIVSDVDVVVLAQASMARVVDSVSDNDIPVPVLSSPERGVRLLKKKLDATE